MKQKILLAISSICAVFAPIEKTIGTVALLILIDLVSGIVAAKKRNEPITSAGLRRTISKLVIFELSLCIGFLAEHYISGSLPFTNLIGSFISLGEMTSVMENLNEISGGSLLTTLIQKIGSQNTQG